MDRVHKFLKRLSSGERRILLDIIKQVKRREFEGLDIKKLKGELNLFRIRKGNTRIIFLKNEETVVIVSIERRNDSTYK